ncbi:MAG: hypothetical protein U0228_08080 [Myxococcaceae bacterium]
MTLSRKDFVRLSIVAVGGASALLGCGTMSGTDGGTGGGSATGGGTGGGSSGGGTGGGSSGGGTGGGSSGGGTGGGATGGGGGATGGGGGSTGGGGGSTGGGGGATGGGGGSTGGGGGATGGGGGVTANCSTNGATASAITFNHGHTLMVPAADFVATGDKIYDITGSALHAHSITLTAAQRATILAGGMVTVTSTLTGHTHDVTVVCA